MGLIFRKRKKLSKNVTANLSKSGISLSGKAGPLTVNSRGPRDRAARQGIELQAMRPRISLVLVGAALLSGCGGPSPASSTPMASGTTPATTRSATPVAERTYAITCGQTVNGKRESVTFASLEEAWAYSGPIPLTMCEATSQGGAYTDLQRAAILAAGYKNIASVDTLYSLCAETDGYYTQPDTILSPGQMREVGGMLTLCPDFPKADELQARIAASSADQEMTEAGEIFYEGTKIVGEDVQPGTYVIEQSLGNCYWERLDPAGNIIDNNFISARTRVEVTILATDYAFNSTGCGKWVAQ